jgi:hypothetical protein
VVDGHARTIKFDRDFEAHILIFLEELGKGLDSFLIGLADEAGEHTFDLTGEASRDWGFIFDDAQLLGDVQSLLIPFSHEKIVGRERKICKIAEGKNNPLRYLPLQFYRAESFTPNPFVFTRFLSNLGEKRGNFSRHP